MKRNIKVLWFEDELERNSLYKKAIENNFVLYIAQSPLEFIDNVSGPEKFSVILLDIMAPEFNRVSYIDKNEKEKEIDFDLGLNIGIQIYDTFSHKQKDAKWVALTNVEKDKKLEKDLLLRDIIYLKKSGTTAEELIERIIEVLK